VQVSKLGFCIVVHIVVGPCAKGHFIHAGPFPGSGVLLLSSFALLCRFVVMLSNLSSDEL
jgi:hypothetical protein